MRGVSKKRAERKTRDAYYTPPALAEAVCRELARLYPNVADVLEPACGVGAFLRAARGAWELLELHGCDLAQPREILGTFQRGDFLKTPIRVGWDAVITNPPFKKAEAFVRRALALASPRGGIVAMLLRTSFLGSAKRVALFREHPLRYLQPITPRPSFSEDGKTDAAEYAVFVWESGYTGRPELLPHLTWEKPRGVRRAKAKRAGRRATRRHGARGAARTGPRRARKVGGSR